MRRGIAMTVGAEKSVRVLLTVEEAAEALSIGRTTAFHLIRTGKLTTVRIGRLRRVPVEAVQQLARDLVQ
jgi:excisionase family DNA binding protein